ncbi:MAG: HEAT repeat domain-containing protein [Acidobacteriaceae bacterium]|nr:HEAT repeat domain-containing protein [Acidobacteriaceae bacterium]
MRFAILVLLCSALLPAQTSTPKERQKYVKSLSREGQAGIAKLLPYAQDPDVEVRREVVRTTVAIGGAASLAPLTAALADTDEEVVVRAADGLVNFYLPGYWEQGWGGSLKRAGNKLVSRWTDKNDQVVPAHVEARPEVVAALGKVVSGSGPLPARANAARAVGVLRGRGAIDDLIAGLASKDSNLLYESLVALEKIRDPRVAPRIHYLLRDLDEKVQLAALETVGILKNPESVGPLREAYERARNDKVRRGALSALSQIPAEASRPLFTAQLDSSDEWLRAGAAEGIARLGQAGDRAPLRNRFESETKMRARLGQAFGAALLGDAVMGEFDPLRYLVNTLNQKAWKGIAEAYLIELVRNEPIRMALAQVVPAAAKPEKLSLAMIFGRSGAPAAAPVLDALAKDSDTDVAREALQALRTLRAMTP